MQRDRRLILEQAIALCDAAWDHAVRRVTAAHGGDPDALPGAIRTVELLWSAREAVKRLIGARGPGLTVSAARLALPQFSAPSRSQQ